MSPSRRASSMSNRASRSLSRARGTISLSVKSRAVSKISRCSSVRSRYTGRGLVVGERFPQGTLERFRGLLGPRTRDLEVGLVDRGHWLPLAHRRGEERLGPPHQVVDWEFPF